MLLDDHTGLRRVQLWCYPKKVNPEVILHTLLKSFLAFPDYTGLTEKHVLYEYAAFTELSEGDKNLKKN